MKKVKEDAADILQISLSSILASRLTNVGMDYSQSLKDFLREESRLTQQMSLTMRRESRIREVLGGDGVQD